MAVGEHRGVAAEPGGPYAGGDSVHHQDGEQRGVRAGAGAVCLRTPGADRLQGVQFLWTADMQGALTVAQDDKKAMQEGEQEGQRVLEADDDHHAQARSARTTGRISRR